MYASGRVFLFILGGFLLCVFIFQRLWITKNKHGLLLMALGVLLAMGPGLIYNTCLLYTSDAADEPSSVDLGGRRTLKKKNVSETDKRVSMEAHRTIA